MIESNTGVWVRLLEGLGTTVLLTLCGSALAAFFAFTAGLARLSKDVILRSLARLYIELFRGTSALVQLFWFYFALPILLDIQLDALLVGILVLGLNIGAYGAEVVRSGLQSVPREQIEASIALNLTPRQRLRQVIIPQAIPIMLPPFGNLLIELLKGTALVSMITVTDLTRAALYWRDETYRTNEIFGGLLVVYFVLAWLLTRGIRWLERRSIARLGPGGNA
ncbi:MAG: ectoine/hydroxyectoine ABC transporter permease subunit EhuC [Planctomycetota bacterium]